MPFSSRVALPRAARRWLLAAPLLALGAALALPASAFARAPEGDGPAVVIAPPGVDDSTISESSGQGRPGGGPRTARGYDVSYPQCNASLPSNALFAIVGVNGGRVFSVNPCLAAQIAWGGGTAAELYANTGNPGPSMSNFWPKGQTSPRFCDPANADTADCAFDYGWNAAKHSFETAQAAYQQLGISTSPSATTWWLDVETSNSWRTDTTLNVAALQGGVAYLRDVAGVTKLGFYSTTFQWGQITGGTTSFSPAPSWGAGASSEKTARSLCASTTTSFTGGKLAMVQYIYQGLDADVRC